jgi:hypothetical protein
VALDDDATQVSSRERALRGPVYTDLLVSCRFTTTGDTVQGGAVRLRYPLVAGGAQQLSGTFICDLPRSPGQAC